MSAKNRDNKNRWRNITVEMCIRDRAECKYFKKKVMY